MDKQTVVYVNNAILFHFKRKRFWEDDSVESTRNLFLYTANNYRVCLMLTTLGSTEDLQLPRRGLDVKLGYFCS